MMPVMDGARVLRSGEMVKHVLEAINGGGGGGGTAEKSQGLLRRHVSLTNLCARGKLQIINHKVDDLLGTNAAANHFPNTHE
ncbi:hypothetical protein Zmor_012819 [Zophobas morio]|uniref:Uncharacterized protein n=1 Tax=Zophobas morio TaxID=2755281 RepID=A0AA38IGA7_9CUCU|nr:hypothetical protein Zmor_012819 [Zophobas morio]